MALPKTDAFTGTDGTALSTYDSGWVYNTGTGWTLGSNAVYLAGSGDHFAHWEGDTFNANQYAQAVFVGGQTGAYLGVAARCASGSTATGYVWEIEQYATNVLNVYLAKVSGGTWTELYSAQVSGTIDGATIRIETEGTSIRGYLGASKLADVTDSSISSGYAGIVGYLGYSSFRLDSFEAGDLSGPVTITPGTIASTTTLVAPTLAPGAVTIAPSTIASTTALPAPTLVQGQTITPSTIASTTTLVAPTLAPGAVTIAPSTIVSTTALVAPTLLGLIDATSVITHGHSSSGVYPYSVSGRRILRADGASAQFVGDAAWSLFAQLSLSEAETYFADRQAKGVNLLLASLTEHKFTEHTPAWDNYNGDPPFDSSVSGELDFTDPNTAYWSHVTALIDLARAYGITILALPAYLGYGYGDEGWAVAVGANGVARMETYGEWLAAQFANTPNIIWCMGGDAPPGDYADEINALANALSSGSPWHLMTAHSSRGNSSVDDYDEPWLQINSTYGTPATTHSEARTGYQASTLPMLYIEGYYGNSSSTTTAELMLQLYHVSLAGGIGSVGGNCPTWYFGTDGANPGDAFADTPDLDWSEQLDAFGAALFAHYATLLRQRDLAGFTPDFAHTRITAGYGSEGTGYAPAAYTTNQLVAYTPGSTLTLAEGQFTAGSYRIRWMDPSTGVFSNLSTVTFGSDPRSLAPPDSDPWVVLVDLASLEAQVDATADTTHGHSVLVDGDVWGLAQPSTIASTTALPAPTIVLGAVTITPATIASTTALQAPTIVPGAVTITPATIASTTALVAPTLVPGAVTLAPATIASTTALPAPTLEQGGTSLSVDSIASTTALPAPTLVPGAITVVLDSIPANDVLPAPTLAPGAITIAVASIASLAACYSPSINTSTAVETLPSSTVVVNPTIVPGPVTIAPTTIASTTALVAPTLAPGAVALAPSTIVSTAQCVAPTIAFGAITIEPSTIASTAGLVAPTLAPGAVALAPSTIASTTQCVAPTIAFGAITIEPSTIASTAGLDSPTLSSVYTLEPSTIASTAVLADPALVPGVLVVLLETLNGSAHLVTPALSLTDRAPAGYCTLLFTPGEDVWRWTQI